MSPRTPPRPVDVDPQQLIADWVEAGLIRPEQADALTRDLDARRQRAAAPVDVPSFLVEGVGYLGGAIVVSASLTLVARYWHDLSSPVRVALASLAAVGLLAAARAVTSDRGAAVRVRSVLLAAAVVAFAALVTVAGNEYGASPDSLDLAAVVTSASAVYAALLWWSNPTVLQQMTTYFALLGAVAVASRELGGPAQLAGAAAWAVSLAWLLLAWGGVLKPRAFIEAMAAVGAVFSALTTVRTDAGNVLAVTTSVALVGAAVLLRNLALLAIGSVGALLSVTIAISDWFPGALTAPLSLLLVGGALVAVAVVVAPRRAGVPAAARLAVGSARVAVTAATAELAIAAAVIVAVGLTWVRP